MIASHRWQRHPIPMDCHFEHSLVVAWAVPAATLEPLVAPGLTLDVYDGRWGFVAVAIVGVRGLRPRHLPAFLGRPYLLTGYRTFVRHRDADGRTRRGLDILRSDTDRRTMQVGGNLLTHYNYQLAAITMATTDQRIEVAIESPRGDADLHLVAHLGGSPSSGGGLGGSDLPVTSPFASMGDARRYAGPLPWTFDHEPETDSIVMIHGRRSSWHPEPVAVDVKTCTFLERAPFTAGEARLANAFHVADIDYGWDRGVVVPNARADR